MNAHNKVRAIVLFSGGLDSQLAVELLKAQGTNVTGLVFQSIFFNTQAAKEAAPKLNIPVILADFNDTILALLDHPRHGFGAAMNPCIDCHIAMIAHAGHIMRENGFDFVATGEVLNERPMSQNRKALDTIARDAGIEGYLLRPLSAKLLPITEPEKRNLVDREKLLAIEGRSRKPQMALAREFGISSYPQPAGGCLLTDPGYGRRLRELKKHEGLGNIPAIHLLRAGRHFRLGKLRLIVGRNQADNDILKHSAENNALILYPGIVPGPTAILPGEASESEINLAASICARYSDSPATMPVIIEVHRGDETKIIRAMPAGQVVIDNLRI